MTRGDVRRWVAVACIVLGVWLIIASVLQNYWLGIALGLSHSPSVEQWLGWRASPV